MTQPAIFSVAVGRPALNPTLHGAVSRSFNTDAHKRIRSRQEEAE